jgi:(4S)-4-hydroxy-5-phosphonooxypentane-2,3-dione isomerase
MQYPAFVFYLRVKLYTFIEKLFMIVTIVHVYVKPEHVEDFILATRDNHVNSVMESGNFRFDILQDEKDPGKFVLYEAYASDKEISAHRETAHYLKWKDMVAPWMVKPREAVRHRMLFPDNR